MSQAKTYMHQSGLAFPIAFVKQVEHILLELLAIFIDCLACLGSTRQHIQAYAVLRLTSSDFGRSTSFATVVNRRKMIATCFLPSLPSFFNVSSLVVSPREN